MNSNQNDNSISKYDRLRGNLQDVAIFTRPSTIKNVQSLTGRAETFVVETCRFEDEKVGGDFIFVECIDDVGVTRIALPPKVSKAIAAQRDSLTAKRRSMAGKKLAKERKDRGELPGFMRNKKEDK